MIQLDVVTPVRKLVEGAQVESVTIPGGVGQLQILPGHRDLLTTLTTGLLSYKDSSGVEKFASISYGFAEVKRDRVMVLAETCELADEIDLERAQEAQKRAEEKLADGGHYEEFEKHRLKLERSLIRQQIAEK